MLFLHNQSFAVRQVTLYFSDLFRPVAQSNRAQDAAHHRVHDSQNKNEEIQGTRHDFIAIKPHHFYKIWRMRLEEEIESDKGDVTERHNEDTAWRKKREGNQNWFHNQNIKDRQRIGAQTTWPGNNRNRQRDIHRYNHQHSAGKTLSKSIQKQRNGYDPEKYAKDAQNRGIVCSNECRNSQNDQRAGDHRKHDAGQASLARLFAKL